MKKLICFLLFLSITMFLEGCSGHVSIYPVEGPLVDSGTAQKIDAQYTYGGGHGEITFVMPDGEIVKGEYSTVSEGQSTSFFSLSKYQQYYGSAFSTSNKQFGQAIGYGNKGTVIQIEYYADQMTSHGYGLGKDNHGNIYKILF